LLLKAHLFPIPYYAAATVPYGDTFFVVGGILSFLFLK
jgi:hypothetical protein